MRPITVSYTPAAALTTHFATGLTGAGPFTPTTTTTGDNLAHLVTITSAANISGSVLTIIGTDADGHTQTEDITGPNIGTSTGTKHFLTISSITADVSLGANTMDVGISAVSVGPTIPLNWRSNAFSVSLFVDISGTINYTVQHTFQNVYAAGDPAQGTWMSHSSLASKTADTDGNYAFPVMGTRVIVNSVTAGATYAFTILQGETFS